MMRLLMRFSAGLLAASAQAEELRPVDIEAKQWSAVAQINTNAYGRCTGVLIAPARVVTAAHCLFNKRTGRLMRPQSIHVVLGYDRGEYGFHSVASEVVIGTGYDPRENSPSAADYAVLHLADIAPDEFLPMIVAEEVNPSADLITAGFARDRREMLSASPMCKIRSRLGEHLLLTDCQVEHGMSGGPLIDASTWRLVGIQIASGNTENGAVSLAIDAKSIRGLEAESLP